MIHHVAQRIPPARLEDCQRFYELLGFSREAEPAGIAGRAVWLELGPTQIHLMPAEDAPQAHAGHVAVVVDDYQDAVARLRQAGHEVQPRREHWGSPRCYVNDPAGNLVELMAWPPNGDAVSQGTRRTDAA